MMTEALNGWGAEKRTCEPDEVFGSLTEDEMDALRREASSEYSGRDAYRDHVKYVADDPNAEPSVPYSELSDMAQDLYETEADMVRALQGRGEQ